MSYITVSEAASVAGLHERTVYNLIDTQKIPVESEVFMGKVRYKIPTAPFLIWMERKIEKLDQKSTALKKNYKKLKEYTGQ